MLKRSLPESILAIFAGRERGAAIYGDLTEMAASRSRAWFLVACARTLLSLVWRPFAAFVAGVGVTWAVLVYAEQPLNMGEIFLAIGHPRLTPLVEGIRSGLWFLVPFAAICYGMRDKAVQLALAMLVATSGIYYLGFWLDFDPLLAECIACGLLVVACVAFTPWRAALIPFAGFLGMGLAASEAMNQIQWVKDLDYRDPAWLALVLVYTLAASIVFSRLRAWIQRPSQLTGATHA